MRKYKYRRFEENLEFPVFFFYITKLVYSFDTETRMDLYNLIIIC